MLPHFEQFDYIDKGAIAVGQARGNDQLASSPHFHAFEASYPALDDLAGAKHPGEWFPSPAVFQSFIGLVREIDVVDGERMTHFEQGATPFFQVSDDHFLWGRARGDQDPPCGGRRFFQGGPIRSQAIAWGSLVVSFPWRVAATT